MMLAQTFHEDRSELALPPGYAESDTPEAMYFGDRERPLFGFLHAAIGPARGVGVVLCNPFGYEAVCAHRTYRHLAERLARAGYAVLRFDYDGTLDSTGSDSDPGRVRAWVESIHAAISELRAQTSVDRLVLFGTRLGALLALSAASERSDLAGLILWAPCGSGKAYLRELRALRALHAGGVPEPDAQRADGSDEAAGFQITRETRAELSSLDVAKLQACGARRALVISRAELAGDARVLEQLSRLGVEVESASLPGFPEAFADPHLSSVPDPVLGAAQSWLDTLAGESASPVVADDTLHPESTRVATPAEGSYRERALRFGLQQLFGILTEPNPRAAMPVEPGVLFLNPGAVSRVGMNRMYVTLARQLATEGTASLRFDISGIGDSQAEPGTPELRIYSKHAVKDVVAALDALSTYSGANQALLIGLCAGAYAAYHTALRDPRVGAVVLINPQTFDYKPGDSLEIAKRRNYREATYYKRSMLRPESWAKAMRGQVDFRYVLRVMQERARNVARSKLQSWRRSRQPNPLFQQFLSLCERGCRVYMIYSNDDPGLEHFDEQLGSTKATLLNHPNFRLQVLDGADHTFTPLESQGRLAEVLGSHVAECRRTAGAHQRNGSTDRWRSQGT